MIPKKRGYVVAFKKPHREVSGSVKGQREQGERGQEA